MYFERGSTSEYKIVTGYQTFARELCVANGESYDLQCVMNTRCLGKNLTFFSVFKFVDRILWKESLFGRYVFYKFDGAIF